MEETKGEQNEHEHDVALIMEMAKGIDKAMAEKLS